MSIAVLVAPTVLQCSPTFERGLQGTGYQEAFFHELPEKEELMKVLVATDGSEHSMKAVNRALELAMKEGAEVTLMSVAYYAREDLDEMPANIQEKLESHAAEALKKAKAVFDEKSVQVETLLEAGFVPANNIIRRAEEGQFERILLGSTGISGLKRVFIGSTAAKVVANAPCSVTVVR
jgi:nucleotide-binding universal stress UspA family protein